MENQNVIYTNIFKKEENPAIFNNMDGPWGRSAKWNRSDSKDKYCVASLYVEKQSRIVVAWGWVVGETGRGW